MEIFFFANRLLRVTVGPRWTSVAEETTAKHILVSTRKKNRKKQIGLKDKSKMMSPKTGQINRPKKKPVPMQLHGSAPSNFEPKSLPMHLYCQCKIVEFSKSGNENLLFHRCRTGRQTQVVVAFVLQPAEECRRWSSPGPRDNLEGEKKPDNLRNSRNWNNALFQSPFTRSVH